MITAEEALAEFGHWYDQLTVYPASGGPAKGTIGGALVVLDRLKTDYDLDIDKHTTDPGSSQIKGVSGAAVKKILEKYGETRRFVTEGGRTNRGLRGDIITMLETLKKLNLHTYPSEDRNRILSEFQRYLAQKVAEYHSRERLKFVYDPSKSAWQAIHELLEAAREKYVEGPVAEYLVGAKLQLRFPEFAVRNESYSVSDEQSELPGDFVVGDTVFHVTVAPMMPLLEKCLRNLETGYRVYILTRDSRVGMVRSDADQRSNGRISVSSIESFVAQNLEELSEFAQNELGDGFYALLTTYNCRTDVVETNKSMLIEIPENLRRRKSGMAE